MQRRDVLKASALAFPAILSGAQDVKPIKVGLVGCGGRGTAAAIQALKADDYAQLMAVADVDMGQLEKSLAEVGKAAGPKVKVEAERRFLGPEAYRQVIDSDIDVVLLATPPGFRPGHLRYAIEKGKHVFCEKPIAVDAPGVRSVLETAKMAREKNLSLVAGFCWRYANQVQAAFDQVKNGAIGDIVAYYATYYTSPVKPMPPEDTRPAGISDVQWQVRNWYNFCWTCGDSIVEQAVHSVDKVAWAMGDKPPVSCVAVGGRQIPANGGNIYDHFEANYVWPNGARAFVACRQIPGCYGENGDYVMGTKGQLYIGRGNPKITGQTNWQYEGQKGDMYQAEHDALFASIRQGKPLNDGEWMAHSTLLAILGRMAAYTGQQLTWEQALNSQEKIFPDPVDWNGSLPVVMPLPGKTKFY
jgi:myo-inositol 2-dehydrogenase / D-chiro-inositol 1-dehydrogenase